MSEQAVSPSAQQRYGSGRSSKTTPFGAVLGVNGTNNGRFCSHSMLSCAGTALKPAARAVRAEERTLRQSGTERTPAWGGTHQGWAHSFCVHRTRTFSRELANLAVLSCALCSLPTENEQRTLRRTLDKVLPLGTVHHVDARHQRIIHEVVRHLRVRNASVGRRGGCVRHRRHVDRRVVGHSSASGAGFLKWPFLQLSILGLHTSSIHISNSSFHELLAHYSLKRTGTAKGTVHLYGTAVTCGGVCTDKLYGMRGVCTARLDGTECTTDYHAARRQTSLDE